MKIFRLFLFLTLGYFCLSCSNTELSEGYNIDVNNNLTGKIVVFFHEKNKDSGFLYLNYDKKNAPFLQVQLKRQPKKGIVLMIKTEGSAASTTFPQFKNDVNIKYELQNKTLKLQKSNPCKLFVLKNKSESNIDTEMHFFIINVNVNQELDLKSWSKKSCRKK